MPLVYKSYLIILNLIFMSAGILLPFIEVISGIYVLQCKIKGRAVEMTTVKLGCTLGSDAWAFKV